ncbi:MAG: restriction endonuclease [Bacteroidaceae bacterium]|nr:restriction endonuclease [Bacteroidaceae bacterium]
MPIQVEREKWILYKHTNNYDLIQAVALDVKNHCGTDISETERYRMQARLAALDLYHTRNPRQKPLDSINHRINTLEFFMFGYESVVDGVKRFIFSPLGNLFLSYIDDEDKKKIIFTTMLFAMQFQHPANGTPNSFQLYPFRLIFQLLLDSRLEYRLSFLEYIYCLADVKTISESSYNQLIDKILEIRHSNIDNIIEEIKDDEHYYVNCVYEWQYYITNLLHQAGIFIRHEGTALVKLYHPSKPTSISSPTGRVLKDGYIELAPDVKSYINQMLAQYSCFEAPIRLDSPDTLQADLVKEIYSFYPQILTDTIGGVTNELRQLLELPKLITEYSNNPEGGTAYLFEQVLEEGFNMFYDVEARKRGGAGHTDIECIYLHPIHKKKFAVEAKSTQHKLGLVNSGRLRTHREEIGGAYTIVITPRIVPAVRSDIKGQNIVIILANTFSEYLYNHIYHDVRDMSYEDFDIIVMEHMGEDISKYISNMTIEKFSART